MHRQGLASVINGEHDFIDLIFPDDIPQGAVKMDHTRILNDIMVSIYMHIAHNINALQRWHAFQPPDFAGILTGAKHQHTPFKYHVVNDPEKNQAHTDDANQ